MITKKTPNIRYLHEMKSVLYDQRWLKKTEDFEVYRFWRGVKKKNNLRYDITLMHPRMLGKEFVRTKGNQNSNDFSELYTVLAGEAIFILQKVKGNIVEDVYAVRVKKGEWILASAAYAVIMINPLKRDLKTGNWVSEKNENIYKELEKMKGACYFYTTDDWVKNSNYAKIPELHFVESLKEMPNDFKG